MQVLKHNSRSSNISSTLFFGQLFDEDIEISIVIPTYNRLDALQVAINSALNQANHYRLKYEVIVVDNNPDSINDKNIQTTIKDWEYRNFRYFVNSENIGMMANWNRGIELSCGKWIIQLHDDDYFLPNFLETISKDITRFNTADVIVHHTITHDKRKTETVPDFKHKKKSFCKLNSFHVISSNYHISAALIKRECLYTIGGFDVDMYPISDYDFTQKSVKSYNVIAVFNDPLVVIVFGENETLNPRVFEKWFTIARKIKQNAILDFNPVSNFFLNKVIDYQINIDIKNIVEEVIDKSHKSVFDDKFLSVGIFDKVLWKIYNLLFNRLYNFFISKKY